MTHNEKVASLREELARQDVALEEARQDIEAFGDALVDVPHEWLQAIEDACATPPNVPTAPVYGIRG